MNQQANVESIQAIADFHAAGILKALQPRQFGGYEMGWDVLCEISMELARGCGSQAWVADVLMDHKYILTCKLPGQ